LQSATDGILSRAKISGDKKAVLELREKGEQKENSPQWLIILTTSGLIQINIEESITIISLKSI